MQLDPFIEHLQSMAAQQFPLALVTDFLRKSPLDSKILDAHTFYMSERYTRNLMFKCPQFELLLLCWGPQHISPIHGHEGEKCWMRVEEGELHFTNYAELQAVPFKLQEQSSASGSAGFVDGPAGIHRVQNPTDKQARSLHLYARPFAVCDVYDIDVHEKSRRQISYDTMYGRPVGPSLQIRSAE